MPSPSSRRRFTARPRTSSPARRCASTAGPCAWRGLQSLLATLTALAIVAGLIALSERNAALRRQLAAESASLSARSAADLATNYESAGLLSLQSYALDPTTESRNAVLTALEQPTTAILRGHFGTVNSVAYDAADGSLLASAGDDGTVRLWNVASRREDGAPINVIGNVRGYAYHPSDESGSASCVTLSPDGRLLATAAVLRRYSPGGIAVAGETTAIRLFDVGTRVQTAVLLVPGRSVQKLAFSPDGKLLAAQSDDGEVQIFSVASRGAVAMPAGPTGPPVATGVAFSPDGRTLAFTNQGQVRFWDVRAGREIRAPPSVPSGVIGAPAFTPRGDAIATVGTDFTVRLWNLSSGRQLSSFVASVISSPLSVALSPDGSVLALSGSDQEPSILLNISPGYELGPAQSLVGAADRVLQVAFSPDSAHLATANDDWTVRVFTLPGLSALARSLPGSQNATTVAVSRSTIVAARRDGSLVAWNSVGSGAGADPRPISAASPAYVSDLAANPNATVLAVGGVGTVRLVDLLGGATGPPLRLPASSSLHGLAFSPDGRRLAVAGADPAVYLYDTSTHGYLRSLPGGSPWAVAFSPEGRLIADGGDDGRIRLWDARSDAALGRPLVTGGPVRNLAFSPDGGLLESAGNDGTVRLWDVAARRQVALLAKDFSGGVSGAAFSPDGSAVAAVVGCDLQHWDARTHAGLGPAVDLRQIEAKYVPGLGCGGLNAELAFTREGALVVWIGQNGPPIFVWSPVLANRSGDVFARGICSIVARDLSRAEFAAALPGQQYRATCPR
jgi:WD40 repeat protein